MVLCISKGKRLETDVSGNDALLALLNMPEFPIKISNVNFNPSYFQNYRTPSKKTIN